VEGGIFHLPLQVIPSIIGR